MRSFTRFAEWRLPTTPIKRASDGQCNCSNSPARETSLASGWLDAVRDDGKLLRGQSVLGTIIADGGAIDDVTIRRPRQASIQEPLRAAPPAIDRILAGNQVLHTGRPRGDSSIRSGRGVPGVNQIGLQSGDVPGQTCQGDRIGLEPLANHKRRNAGRAKLFEHRAALFERRDVYVEAVADQPARGATAVFPPQPGQTWQ